MAQAGVDERAPGGPLRCAVLAPAAAPYREPLFASLAARDDLQLRVLYQAGRLAGWDVGQDWLASEHAYDARVLPAWQRARPGRSPLMLPRGVGRGLDAFGPDVVVVWEFGPAALLARAWCSRHRRALVHFSELGAAAARAVAPLQRRLHGVLARRAAGAIGASTQARDRLLELGADPLRTVVSLQSVDAEPIRAAVAARLRARPPAPGQRPGDRPGDAHPPLRLLCVARLVADKNLGTLIEATASAGPGAVELDLVGDGPLRARLQSLASAAGAVVRFHGALSAARTAQAYADADALALVSHHEPFGVALREGVAAGLPLIASAAAGATGDIAVAGRNAIVVDPGDTPGVAAAVRTLAQDGARRAAMAQASRELDAEWPLQRSVDGFARAVLLAGGRGG
jgi:glycosyltransferase involved in cell wall biosynthesis